MNKSAKRAKLFPPKPEGYQLIKHKGGHSQLIGYARVSTRDQKFRQAAVTYLHVGLLYEAAVWVAWRNGLLPTNRGPVAGWLLAGAAVVALVFWLLWSRRSAWTARIVCQGPTQAFHHSGHANDTHLRS